LDLQNQKVLKSETSTFNKLAFETESEPVGAKVAHFLEENYVLFVGVFNILFIWSILKVCKSQKLSLNNIFKIDHLV
jgi:hypothetical protein